MSIPFSNGRPLPLEILERIAHELVGSSPLGTPHQLLPLLLTNRAVHQALSIQSNTPLYSHICRLKFDVGAVTRRAFSPSAKDLEGHLIQMCNLLRFIRRGDSDDPDLEPQLLIAYVAMLDNDGKNRAQLKHAGIEDFLDRFVRSKLHAEIEANDMWPDASVENSCALWLMWMFTTKESLQRESPQQREEIIRLVFPYIACPFRYSSAFAPPNHFTLPLGKTNPVQTDLFTTETAHGPYPLYHIIKTNAHVLWHFRCNALFLHPLITPAAQLLYWSRREINPFFQNPILPATREQLDGRAGLTQEDLADFNRHKVAKLIDDVLWDWDVGAPVCRAEDGTLRIWKEDESAKWDNDWWRARLCDDLFFKQPRWRLGPVYVRGTLSGQWQGIQFTRTTSSLSEMLTHPQRPTNFSEQTLIFGARPRLMRLTEHGFVRTPNSKAEQPIPLGSPVRMPITVTTSDGPGEAMVPIDASLSNAWFPGPTGSLKWVENGGPLDEGVLRDRYLRDRAHWDRKEAMGSTTFIVSSQGLDASRSAEFNEVVSGPVEAKNLALLDGRTGESVHVYETYDRAKEGVHERMLRAKDKGDSCQIAEREEAGVSSSTTLVHPGCFRCEDRETFLASRKEMDRESRNVEYIFASVGMGKRRATSSYFRDDEDMMDLDEDGEDEMEPVDFDFEDEEDAQEVGQYLESSMSPILPSTSPTVPLSRSESCSSSSDRAREDGYRENEDEIAEPDVDYDYEQGHPGVRSSSGSYLSEPLRRSHDRYRVEECAGGVEDVVVTGDLSGQHQLAWGKHIFYGRVRPWDGLVAILQIGYDRNAEANAHIIYYGYIYGGDTFVGSWRFASMDPLMPGFECSFVMSKRVGS